MKVTKYEMELCDRIPFLVKESETEYGAKAMRITSPKEVDNLAREVFHLHKKAEEHLYLLGLSQSGELLGAFHLSKGSVNSSMVSGRSIFQRAFMIGATRIILIHNHPSGSSIPSQDDITVTERIKQIGEMMEIPLSDHIIIGDDYFSFCNEKML